MKASLDQRVDCQVKCDRSIQFRATKREVVVKTTMRTTTVAKSIWQCAKICRRRWSRTESKKPSLFLKAEPLTEHLQRNPTYEKGQGRPLPAQGTPLTNLTIVKLSRIRRADASGRKCVNSMLCKVHPELYIPPFYPTHKECTKPVPFQEVGCTQEPCVLCWFEGE